MTTHFKTILLAGCMTCVALTTTAQTKEEKSILQLMARQENDWNKGNIDAFMEGYWKSDSLTFIGSRGPVYGWKSTLENYKKSYPDRAAMGKLDFNILSVKKLSPEYCFVIGKWHLTKQAGDTGGNYTLLFRKISGKWFIIVDHSD